MQHAFVTCQWQVPRPQQVITHPSRTRRNRNAKRQREVKLHLGGREQVLKHVFVCEASLTDRSLLSQRAPYLVSGAAILPGTGLCCSQIFRALCTRPSALKLGWCV